MFKHKKMLFHPVEIEKTNPRYAALLQEQLGGANGELKAAMQYMALLKYVRIQSTAESDQTVSAPLQFVRTAQKPLW